MRSQHYLLKPGLTVSAWTPAAGCLCNELVRGRLGSPRQLMTQLWDRSAEDNKPEYENGHARSEYFTAAPASGLLILGWKQRQADPRRISVCFTPVFVYSSPQSEIFVILGEKTKTGLTDISVAPRISTASHSVGPKVPSGEFDVRVFIVRGCFLSYAQRYLLSIARMKTSHKKQKSELPHPSTPLCWC